MRWSGTRDRDRVAVGIATAIASFLNFSLVFDANPPDDRKLVGVRDIEAEARRIIAAHDRLMFRKRRCR